MHPIPKCGFLTLSRISEYNNTTVNISEKKNRVRRLKWRKQNIEGTEIQTPEKKNKTERNPNPLFLFLAPVLTP